jgi:hypothetical protein
MAGLRHAFKEWAVICSALAQGKQALILRKGGIAESGGRFEPEHRQFWLYPTWLHQNADALVPDSRPLLEEVEKQRPPEGILHLSHFAQVEGIYQLHDVIGTMKLAGLHLWSEETVRQRFFYRRPGLYVLAVRVFEVTPAHELTETPEYAGCRSWVELEQELPTEPARPVLAGEEFRKVLHALDVLLQPTAFA